MISNANKRDDNILIWSDSDGEENSSSNINSRLVQAKKRSKIVELSESATDEDVITTLQLDYESDNQKIRKAKRNRGEKYYTKNKKIIPAKKFQNKDCKCSKVCKNLITEEERIYLFNLFWEMGDFNKQNTFLYASTQCIPVKRRRSRNPNGSARDCSFKYFLNIKNKSISVCKKFFIETFDISKGRLHRALKAKVIGKDLRGKMKGSCRKSDEKLVASIKYHIQSFPHYESHYMCSHNPERKYLSSDLNVRKMYNMYVEKCKEDNTTYLSEQMYRNIFKKNFNLSFNRPHEDICQKCVELNMKIEVISDFEEKSNLMKEHSIHLKSTELVRKSLKEEQNLASSNSICMFLTKVFIIFIIKFICMHERKL